MELNEALDKLKKAGFITEASDGITFEAFRKEVWDGLIDNDEVNKYGLIDFVDERQSTLIDNCIQNYWDNKYWPHKSVKDNVDDCIKKIIDAVIDDM